MLVLDAGLVNLTDQVIKSRSKKLRTCSEVQLSYTKCFWANPGRKLPLRSTYPNAANNCPSRIRRSERRSLMTKSTQHCGTSRDTLLCLYINTRIDKHISKMNIPYTHHAKILHFVQGLTTDMEVFIYVKTFDRAA